MGDTRVDGGRRWDVLWVHDEAEELRVQHRTTIASDDAWAVVMAPLASGRVLPLQAALLERSAEGGEPYPGRGW